MTDPLSACFDETGHPRSSALVGIAGFVASNTAWRAFDLTWREVLAGEGVPAFHAREFAHSFGPFSSFNNDEARRRRFLRGLLSAITKSPLLPIATFINTTGLKPLPKDGHQHLGGPYRACLLAASRRAIDHARSLRPPRMVDLVVARTSEYRGEAWEVRELLLRDPGRASLTGSLELADAREVPALQAADLLAYEAAKEISRIGAGAPGEPRWPYQVMLEWKGGESFVEFLPPE